MLKLVGSEEKVIEYIAKQYGLSVDQVAPTVKGWLAALPAVPPPSRQRSAPPLLALNASANASSLRRHQYNNVPSRAEVIPIKPPPASAPTGASSAEVMAAMRSLDARLNARNAGRALPDQSGARRIERHQLALLPPSVPENGPLMVFDAKPQEATGQQAADEALAAYMQRSVLVHNAGRLANAGVGSNPTAQEAVRSNWMTRAVNKPAILK